MEKKSKISFDFGRVHFTPEYLRNAVDPITVIVVGCGGTGSNYLMALAKINYSLLAMGHKGLSVRCYDHDKVSIENCGRQLYAESEIGFSKSTAIINRINRFYGFDWLGIPEAYTGTQPANILISCVDNVPTRIRIHQKIVRKDSIIEHHNVSFDKRQYYWIDTGNNFESGQVIMGTCGKIKQPSKKSAAWLPSVIELYPDMDYGTKEEPSCSLAMALQKQDLFINPIVANYAAQLTWKILTKDYIYQHGMYINLETMHVTPKAIKKPA